MVRRSSSFQLSHFQFRYHPFLILFHVRAWGFLVTGRSGGIPLIGMHVHPLRTTPHVRSRDGRLDDE